MTIQPITNFRVTILCCYMLLQLAYSGRSEQFRIEGIISHHIYVGNSNYLAAGKEPNYTNTFSILINRCNYDIEVSTVQSNHYEAAFDGTSLYRLISIIKGHSYHRTGIIEPSEIRDC